MNLAPKVLIACPHSSRHSKIINEWIKHLDSLTYPNFDICIVDNTLNKNYFEKLGKIKSKHKIITWKYNWEPKKEYALQMLANVREEIRKYFVEHKEYSNLFWLDDDIFIPKWGIQKLLSYNKDLVGFYVHVFPKPLRKPCILKSGEIIAGKGLEFFTFSEVNKYKEFAKKFEKKTLTKEEKNLIPFLIKDKWHPNLFQAYGVNIGCLMCSRKVMETIPFRTHPTFLMGEDLWFFGESNEKGFTFWADSYTRPRHENSSWNMINKIDNSFNRKFGIYLAYGSENATGAIFMERGKKK